jgi:serine/threonine-protein kinase
VNESRNPNLPLLGRYQTISELAKSPIGGLVMALDVPEHRIVALRSLPIEGKVAAEVPALLLEAGRWVKGLDDPAIMTPLDVGTQEGLLHAAFLYSIAEPLRGVLRLASFKGSPMPVGVALRIAYDIVLGARAVEACGASPALGDSLCGGLIPDSVLVGQDGRTRLCDVGIGPILRRTYEYGQHPDLLAYAAPEQLEGKGNIDGRSDVFTIGVFLWEMLANRRLFSAHQAPAVAEKVRTFEVPPLDTLQRGAAEPIPSVVAAIVKRALERAPAERYAGTTALLQALETQTQEFMASAQTVQSTVSALVGNIFESRMRAVERAVANSEHNSKSSSIAAPAPISRDPRPRAAVTKNPPPPLVPSQRPAPVFVASSRATEPDHFETLHPDSLAPAPDTVRNSPEDFPIESTQSVPSPAKNAVGAESDGERPVGFPRLPSVPAPPPRASRPAPSITSKPPFATALPTLPTRFELPGAELFATPGLPVVKPIVQAPQVKQPPLPTPPAPSDIAAVDIQVNPVGPTIPAPPDQSVPDASAASEPTRTELRRANSRVAWVAIASLVVFAFAIGLGIRRCASHPSPGAISARVDVPSALPLSDASMTDTAQSAAATPQLQVSQPDAAAKVADASVADLDAGLPSVSAAPKSTPAPARTYVRRTQPRSSGKVVKGRGKVTKTR